jgi:hypothetical protein
MAHKIPLASLHKRRRERFEHILTEHPDAVVIMCSDENTGERFGNALRRVGRCVKLGYTTMDHQVWASWSEYDTRKHGRERDYA